MTFTALNDEQEQGGLYRLSKLYWKEALKCEEAKAFLAGSVMLGSALETLLLLMVNVYAEEAERTGCVPTRGSRTASHAVEAGRPFEGGEGRKLAFKRPEFERRLGQDRKAKLGDYAEVVRMIRNLVHPARYVEDHHSSRVTAKYLQRQFDVVLLCRDWLVDRNN